MPDLYRQARREKRKAEDEIRRLSSIARVFWDNSNIFIPAGYVAARKDGSWAEKSVRIQFDSLFKLACAGRTVKAGVCVGSVPPELQAVWARLRAIGIEVELYERGSITHREQGVDQCLQVHMLRALADTDRPEIAVLLTGDGAGYEGGTGFHADLERMARKGWGVEVLSWDICCSKALREWAQRTGVYVRLEDYYESITFLEDSRESTSLSLTHRQRSAVRL